MVKINYFIKVFLLVLTIPLISGCGVKYTFNNKTYSSAESGLAAQQKFFQEIESKIKPSNKNFAGKAIIITPSKKTCKALGIKRTGHPTEDIINYIANAFVADTSYFGNYIKSNNLFDSIHSVIDDYPKQYANKIKNDYIATIYLHMVSPDQIGWFIMVSPQNIPKQINFDNTADPGYPKIQSWLDNVKNIMEGK